MAEITVYRDTPKRGETDARWCAYASAQGHVHQGTTGHFTPGEAAAALGADKAEQDHWNARFPHHG
jgi:hypothetical protein